MAVFIFRGRVEPGRLPLSIPGETRIKVSDSELCGDAEFAAKVLNGLVTVSVQADADEDFEALHFHAGDLCRSMMDVATLREGVAYQCVLSEVRHPDGSETAIIFADRKLAAAATSISAAAFDDVLELAIADIQVARLMSDAAVMLSWPHYSPIAAGRIVDGLVRQLTGGRTAGHWATLRSILRVDRAYVQFITDLATPPRHGDRLYVPGPDNSRLARRTWILLDRFVAYRLHGPLDPTAFPMLQGDDQMVLD
jgi:hypothetical protein